MQCSVTADTGCPAAQPPAHGDDSFEVFHVKRVLSAGGATGGISAQ
jgi:hypothetical protein